MKKASNEINYSYKIYFNTMINLYTERFNKKVSSITQSRLIDKLFDKI